MLIIILGFTADFQKSLQTPLCIDSKEIPDVDSMKDRMTTIAYEHGLLNGLGQSTAELMLSALESHIKNTLISCISKIRSNRAIGIVTAEAKQQNSGNDKNQSQSRSLMLDTFTTTEQKTSLNAAELAFAFDISPHVLVESPAHVERLTMQYEEEEEETEIDMEVEESDAPEQEPGSGGFLHLFAGILS